MVSQGLGPLQYPNFLCIMHINNDIFLLLPAAVPPNIRLYAFLPPPLSPRRKFDDVGRRKKITTQSVDRNKDDLLAPKPLLTDSIFAVVRRARLMGFVFRGNYLSISREIWWLSTVK